LITTFAVYWPTAIPEGLACRVRLAGVVPLVGVTESQGALDTETVKGSAPPLLFTCNVCGAGAASPVRYEKLALLVFTVRTGGDVTFAVTVTVCEAAPWALMVMVPVCVPGESEAGFRVTFNVAGNPSGVTPGVPLRLIQGAVVVAVKFVEPGLVEINIG
jgi:hypothetical protein